MTKISKIPPKHEMTPIVTLHFLLPQRKQYKYSFSGEGDQSGLHLCILGQSMGCTYLLSHRDSYGYWLGPEHLAVLSASSGNSESKLVFVVKLTVLYSHLAI